MMEYNYYDAMERDILDYIDDNWDELNITNREELEEDLNDKLWTEDSVTGNGSGSYTFNSWKAREYVLDNMDLCLEMIQEFCIEAKEVGEKFLDESWEWFDVSIRCYLLGQVISSVLDGMEANGFFANDTEEPEDLEESEAVTFAA